MTNYLTENLDIINTKLDLLLDASVLPDETARPPRLLEAIRYGVLNGGKRLRPILLIESAKLFGVPVEKSLMASCALELVHCYSLIHDDLPAMDDDDLRRGQPTVHKKYDDAEAILAGDALLTLAFDVLSRPETHQSAEIRLTLTRLLSRAAGLGGMVGGQSLDMSSEQQPLTSESDIRSLQQMKTGRLIRFAFEAGGVLGEANESDQSSLTVLGEKVGLAYQLSDDLLDITSSEEALGKKVSKDRGRNKSNLLTIYSASEAQKILEDLCSDSKAILSKFGERSGVLCDIVDFIITREH